MIQDLITKYFELHAGKSSYIDNQLRIAEQAVKDSELNKSAGDSDFSYTNLAIARRMMVSLIETISPVNNNLRDTLIDIYKAIDEDICCR